MVGERIDRICGMDGDGMWLLLQLVTLENLDDRHEKFYYLWLGHSTKDLENSYGPRLILYIQHQTP